MSNPTLAVVSTALVAVCAACTHPLRLPNPDGGGGATSMGGQLSPAGGSFLSGGATAGPGVAGSRGFSGGASGPGGQSATGGSTGSGGVSGIGGATRAGGSVGGGGTSAGPTGSGGKSLTGGTMLTAGTTSTGVGGRGTGGNLGAGGGGAGGGTLPIDGGSQCVSRPDTISDFETVAGKATTVRDRMLSGYWYVYFPDSDSTSTPSSGTKQTPALVRGSAVATEAAPDRDSCNQFALHSTGSGFGTQSTSPAGFGVLFAPHAPYDGRGDPCDVSQYTGISFRMKSGNGAPPAVFFEVLTQETLPASTESTTTSSAGDAYNHRGQLLNAPWAPNDMSMAYQTFIVPFGTLVPRWLPSSRGPDRSPRRCSTGTGQPKCQAKPFAPKNALGIQISMYVEDGFPKPDGSTLGTYDLWIDDVAFVENDAGLPAREGFPLAKSGSFGKCGGPNGPSAQAKFLVPAYHQWKARFVRDNKVIRPENQDDTLSEGIAFGMLIALNMNDQALFDGLYATWKGNPAAGASTLMTSCLGSGGGPTGQACTRSDGSATGADQDAAYALLMAGRLWGGAYQADAIAMLREIWDNDVDGTGTKLPKGGSKYQSPTGTTYPQITSPSYFAPSYYRTFAGVDPDTSHDWSGVAAAVYQVLKGPISGSFGLVPAWCGKTCTVAASTGSALDIAYQYDAHRLPMRIALDYCLNGTAEAKAYTDLTTAFFARVGSDGIGFITDMYTTTGSTPGCTGSSPGITTSSASVLGTAAVGAMASANPTFLNDAYQAVFDVATRGTLAPPLYEGPDYRCSDGQPTYGYYNATVGLLTLLIMTHNFMH
jgi:endo-1,4-beta-D-glucanase Y